MRERLTAPMIVDFNVTSKCNLKCKFCYSNAECNEDMTFNDIRNSFQVFHDMNVHIVRISGGEPFVRIDIQKILQLTEEFNFAVCLNTNGTLIKDSDIELISEGKLSSIAISLDSYFAEMHDKIRGVEGAFDKTVTVIKKIVQRCSTKLSTTCTLTSINCYPELVEKILMFNKELGVKAVSFQLTSPVGKCAEERELLPSGNQWQNTFLWLTENKEKIQGIDYVLNPTNEGSVFWEFYYPLKRVNKLNLLKEVWGQNINDGSEDDYISCVAGNITVAVAGNGDIYPCELMIGNKELCLGNIKMNNFKEIIGNSNLLDIIFNKRKSDLSGKCSVCEHKFCGGGCRAVAYIYNKDLWGSDERCPYEEVKVN